MAHRSFSYRTVMAGVTVALLLGALMASGLSGGQPAAADEHGDDGGGLTGAVDEVVDGVGDDEEKDEQEAADDGEPEEVVPEDDGGGGDGGQEPASEEPQDTSGGGGGGEPAQDQSSQQSGGSAPVPSGPQTAAGPGVQAGGGLPEGAASPDGGSTFGSSADSDMFATAPEVFTEDDDGQRMGRRPDELALSSLPRDNGPADFAPAGGVPSQLIAAATGLLVMVGAGHALYATRRLAGAPLEVDGASDEGEDDHDGADEHERADEGASND